MSIESSLLQNQEFPCMLCMLSQYTIPPLLRKPQGFCLPDELKAKDARLRRHKPHNYNLYQIIHHAVKENLCMITDTI